MNKSLTIILTTTLIGCATSKNPNDPYEAYNRKVYAFNSAADRYVVRPTAVGYSTVVPKPVRIGISNFYNNLRDFVTLGNNVLQIDGPRTWRTIFRITINSVFGAFGTIDMASTVGLPSDKQSFGSTFKHYGWTNSGYLIFPFFPPSTVRDQIGLIPDIIFNPLWWIINDYWVSGGIFVLSMVDVRAKYLSEDKLLEQTLDPYATLRDLYLQKNGLYVSDNPETQEAIDNINNLIDEANTGKSKNGNSKNGTSKDAKKSSANATDIDSLIDEANQKPKKSKPSN